MSYLDAKRSVHFDWAPALVLFGLNIVASRGASEAIAFRAANTALIFVFALIHFDKSDFGSNRCFQTFERLA